MALFPKLGQSFLDENDHTVQGMIEKFYEDSMTMNQTFWYEADLDSRFESGDQTIWSEYYGNIPAFKQKQFSFNRIRPIKNMISGYQRRNRKSIIATPRENGDNETADQFTKTLMWCCDQDNILETVSDAFDGALVTGLNLLQIWLDFNGDPISGNIRVDNCSYNSFVIDPFFKKTDLSDCKALWKRSFFSKEECINLLPEKKKEIEELPLKGYDRDAKFQYLPESYDFTNLNLMTYDEYYYRTSRKQKLLIDTQTGEVMEWNYDNPDALRQFKTFYPQVIEMTQEIPTVNLSILVQGRVMYDGPNPLGIDEYPFVPVLGYFNPQLPYYQYRVQGVVRGLRDAQYLYNRRKVIELDMAESRITTGIKYKENALVDPNDAFLTGQGKGLALKEEAMMTDVEQMVPVDIPPGFFQLSEALDAQFSKISGANEELLGSAVDEKAGVLSMLRQGAGLTMLQGLFDNLDRSQKLLGRLMIKVIQANFTPGKVKKIIEDEPLPQFYNKAFGKYDAVVEDGLNTATQRQMQFAQMLQLREIGVPIPDSELLEAATIQNKQKIIKTIEAQQQAAQQQQQQEAQVAMQNQEAVIGSLQAKADADKGLAIERISRVDENQELAEERKAQAQKDRMAGVLDLVKALKEIEDIDLGQLERLVALSKSLNQPSSMQ